MSEVPPFSDQRAFRAYLARVVIARDHVAARLPRLEGFLAGLVANYRHDRDQFDLPYSFVEEEQLVFEQYLIADEAGYVRREGELVVLTESGLKTAAAALLRELRKQS